MVCIEKSENVRGNADVRGNARIYRDHALRWLLLYLCAMRGWRLARYRGMSLFHHGRGARPLDGHARGHAIGSRDHGNPRLPGNPAETQAGWSVTMGTFASVVFLAWIVLVFAIFFWRLA